MPAAGKRQRRPPIRFQTSEDTTAPPQADRGQQQRSKPGRRSLPAWGQQPAAAAAEDSSEEYSADEEASDSDEDLSEQGSEDDSEQEGDDCSSDDWDAAAAVGGGLCRPLESHQLGQLADEARGVLGARTLKDYDTIINVLERWYAADGYQARHKKQVKAAALDLGRMSDMQVANLCSRFFTWYVVEGRPRDPLKGGKEVPKGQLGRSAAMKVHSALQLHLTTMRRKAGRPSFQLAATEPYSALYVVWCSKKRDRAMGEAADEECEYRAAVVHTSFGRDPYVQGAHAMLASSDPQQAKLLSMYTGQVQMVARGDDLRGRKLKDLGTRNLACVGPSTAVALTILQPPATGKALKTRPGYKGMLRGKLAALCGIGALFRWLSVRLAVLAESLPRPGTKQFKRFYLWPGRKGGLMSYTTHASHMRELFGKLGVDTTKLTHELRIFAAQLLYEMGVPIEVIQRIGHWLLDAFGTAYIGPGFTAEALLALAFWPGAAQKDFTGYWAERFHVAVPEQLIQLVMPGLAALEEENKQAAAAGKPNKAATHFATVVRMGGTVVVQDALVLADESSKNPVHAMLLKQQSFQELKLDFQSFQKLGGFQSQQPRSMKELIAQQTQQLQDHIVRTFTAAFSGHAPPLNMTPQLNWSAMQQQVQEAEVLQQQTRAFQPEPVDAAAELAKLSSMAAGKADLSQQILQQVRQQQDVLAAQDSTESSVSEQDSDTEDEEQTAAGGPPAKRTRGAAAAATAAAAARAPASPADAAAAVDIPAAAAAAGAAADIAGASLAARAAPGTLPSAAAAAAAAAGASGAGATGGRAGSAEVQWQYEVQEPTGAGPSAFTTPSGKKHTAEQLYSRSEHTLTPGGAHQTAFFTSRHLEHLREQHQQQHQQQQQGGGSSSQLPLVPFMQQQQQMLDLLRQLAGQQQGAAVPAQQQQHPAAAGAGSPGGGTEVEQLRQQLQAAQQQVQQLTQAQQQIQQAAAAQQVGAMSSQYASRLGAVDPLGSIMQPWIAAQQGLNAVLGAANNSSLLPAGQNSGITAAQLMAVLDLRDGRLEQRLSAAVVAAVQGSSLGAAAAAAGGLNAVHGTAAAAGEAVPGAGAEAQAAAAAAAVAGQAGADMQRVGFPELSTHSTMVELAEWYYCKPLGDTGLTPQQHERAGKADKQQWRGGSRGPRFRRRAEYVQLLRAIERSRDALQQQARSSSRHPHSVEEVDSITAARELDRQRERLGLSVCEYRQFIVGSSSSKGYKKGKSAEERLQQEEQQEEQQQAAAEAATAAGAAAAAAGAGAAAAAAGTTSQGQGTLDAAQQGSGAAGPSPRQPSAMQQLQQVDRERQHRGQQKGRGAQCKKS